MEESKTNSPGNTARMMKTAWVVAGILLIIALTGWILFVLHSGRLTDEKEALSQDNASLEQHLQQLQETKAGLEAGIVDLQQEMDELATAHREEINQKDARIARLGRQAAEAESLRERIAGYEKMEKDYRKMQGQYTQLLSEWDDLDQKHKRVVAKLQKTQDSLDMVRGLQAYNVSALTRWDRWLWADRYHVSQANRVDETRITFEINANPLEPEGNRMVYLCMIGPGEQVLYPSGESFEIAGSGDLQPYTQMKEVAYTGEAQQVRFGVDHPDRLAPGTYTIEIYIDGALAGTTRLRFD
jgi:uncharacterized protein YlxW (UPF0749 family)